MASMTIRNLEDRLKSRLRVRAAMHDRSMEDEARDILRTELERTIVGSANLADAIRAHIEPLGGVELVLPAREPIREAPAAKT